MWIIVVNESLFYLLFYLKREKILINFFLFPSDQREKKELTNHNGE